jgi:hypothetical protein
MAVLGFEQGIGFIPFAGIGGELSRRSRRMTPLRSVRPPRGVGKRPDLPTTALTDASGDKSWIVQTAALARHEETDRRSTQLKYMADEKTQ